MHRKSHKIPLIIQTISQPTVIRRTSWSAGGINNRLHIYKYDMSSYLHLHNENPSQHITTPSYSFIFQQNHSTTTISSQDNTTVQQHYHFSSHCNTSFAAQQLIRSLHHLYHTTTPLSCNISNKHHTATVRTCSSEAQNTTEQCPTSKQQCQSYN